MRRLCAISAVCLFFAAFIVGCSRQAAKNDDKQKVEIDPTKVKIDPQPIAKNKNGADKKKIQDDKKNPVVADDKQEKYEDALAHALSALAERNWNEALEAFESAKSFQDTEFVNGEIARLKARIDQDGVAKNAVKNIETVLNDGSAEEAAKLAGDALKEFGDGDDADKLAQLRIQAEAVRDAEKKEDAATRFARFKKEGDLALEEKNLRAAALAFEQALEAKSDADLKMTYDGARAKVDEYDALRKKANELRRDPQQLEGALEALKAAAAAWETLQIRADIDDCQLALAKRRDTLAVADFELRNDVGLPGAGAAIAEELLPQLKPKFDLVERGQLQQVLAELQVQQSFLDDFKQQQQIGRLAKARYLVVGSVQRLVGVTIRARLVDTQTGLVVQTGKIVALSMEDALNQIPDLAKQLLMTDAARQQFEQDMQAKAAQPVEKAPEKAVVPPAPLPPAADAPPPPPPPPPMVNPAPPVFVDVKIGAFKNFVPQPEIFVAPQIDPLQLQFQNRWLFASIERGDYLFRAGRFREAYQQYSFALTLAPDNWDVRLRLERCVPYVPPNFVLYPRQRIAVMPFMTVSYTPFGPPAYLAYWTPNNLSPYFAWRYDVADPAEIYWFMGRVGLTMNDLLNDPNARRWLGRAVGVRYFVFGNLNETTSFDVNTYLIDAEFGYQQSAARINVRDAYELKLRLPELAELTMLSPAEQAAYLQTRLVNLVANGRRHLAERRYQQAVREFEAALQIYPYNVEVRVLLQQAQSLAMFQDFEENRRRQYAAQQAQLTAQRQRQWELAQAAERGRRQALAEAAARDQAQTRIHLGFRIGAQANLLTRAEIALKTRNFGLSLSFFNSAAAFTPPPANVVVPVQMAPINYQSFAQARLETDRAQQLRVAQFTAAREATLRQEREKQIAAAQQQLVNERAAAQTKLNAARKTTLERDEVGFSASKKHGMSYMAQSKYEAALAAFQGAQRLAHTPKQSEEINNFIDVIGQRQAEALAKTKEEKSEVERKLAQDSLRRKATETQAKQNEQNYQLALSAAQTALAAKNYALAKTKFDDAGQIFKTDAVLSGLKKIETEQAAATADTQKVQAEKQKSARVQQLLADGKAALDGKKYADALASFREAKKLAPDNLDVIAGLTQIEQATSRLSAEQLRKSEEASRTQNFQRLLKSGQANLANKKYEAAVANLQEAVKLNPTDTTAVNALKNAEKARDGAFKDAKSLTAAKERADAYQKLINEGQLALDSKRYGDAIKAFSDAHKQLPGDKASTDYLADAQTAKKAAEDAMALAAKKRTDDMKKAADLQTALTQGRSALAGKDFSAVAKALAVAQKLGPDNVDVKTALRDLEQAQKQAAADSAALKRRKQEFDTLVATGKTALNAKNYPAALKALSSATTLMPDNTEAQDLFRRAQTESRQAEETLAKSKLQDLITTGLANIKSKNYDAAEKALRSAAQVDPKNSVIVQGLKDIEAGRNVQANEKLVANYKLVLAQGQKALQSNDFKNAIALANQALKLMPNDTGATNLLQQAQLGQTRLTSYQSAIQAGNNALKAKEYANAAKAFNEALKLFPNDATARAGLASAKKGPGPEPVKFDYNQSMQRGFTAENNLKYADALKAYQEALKAKPNDQQATARANFAQAIVHAEQAINNAMWVEAQREVDNALRLQPKNAHALKLQQRVKNKK